MTRDDYYVHIEKLEGSDHTSAAEKNQQFAANVASHTTRVNPNKQTPFHPSVAQSAFNENTLAAQRHPVAVNRPGKIRIG